MTSLPTKSRQWTLSTQPTGKPTYKGSNSSFTLETKDIPELKDNQVLVKTLYLSNDPAQRGWISPPSQIDPKRLYVPPVEVGASMRARGIGKVIASKTGDFKEGDLVTGGVNWKEYAVLDTGNPAAPVRKVTDDPKLGGVTQYLGALGLTGLTAWYGLCEIGGLKKGERVVVSGAAGATGNMVVQIAKNIVGASYVVGIAGSEEKCRWVESLGADKCLNYKSKDFVEQLNKACGDGVDVYFDNVGGEITDAMLPNIVKDGRVAACGAITGYNGENAAPMKNWFQIVTMRLQIRGFIVMDFMAKGGDPAEIVGKLVAAVKEGKVKLGDEVETVVDTPFEEVPGTWLKLFEGGNQGKLVTKITG